MTDAVAHDPKRRDSSRTKAAILSAALSAFSKRGYAQTGIREIAAIAGVNSSLVARYFGSKEALFAVALKQALSIDILLTEGRQGFGRHVADLLIRPDPPVDPLAMMILATADPEARSAAVSLLNEVVIGTLSDWIGPPDGRARAAQISVLCSGFVTYRRLLPIDALAPGREGKVAQWLARSLQAVVDGE